MSGAQLNYSDLSNWNNQNWQQLDVFLFIYHNEKKFRKLVINKMPSNQLPSDAMETIPSLFFDHAYAPLKKAHQAGLNHTGHRRNVMMFGVLEKISITRVRQAFTKEFTFYNSLDEMTLDESNYEIDRYIESIADPAWLTAQEDRSFVEKSIDSDDENNIEVSLEWLRHKLTPQEYQFLNLNQKKRLTPIEIAEQAGTTDSNVRILLKRASEKIMIQ